MILEDYGVWLLVSKMSQTNSYAITEDSPWLDKQVSSLGGTRITVLNHGNHWASIMKKQMNEWSFMTHSRGVSIGIEIKYDPMTVKEMLENVRPYVFTYNKAKAKKEK